MHVPTACSLGHLIDRQEDLTAVMTGSDDALLSGPSRSDLRRATSVANVCHRIGMDMDLRPINCEETTHRV